METLRSILDFTNGEKSKLSVSILRRKNILHKWESEPVTDRRCLDVELNSNNEAAEDPEIVPDLLHRVDRALELVSKFKEADSEAHGEASCKETSNANVKLHAPAAPQSSARIKAPSLGPRSRPPVKAAPKKSSLPPPRPSPSGTARFKPAHVTAPFKTNPNLPASNYRRPRTPATGAAKTRRPVTAANPRQWLSSGGDARPREGDGECTGAKNSREGAGTTAKFAAIAPEPLQSSGSKKEPPAATAAAVAESNEWISVRQVRGTDEVELRRSLSAESLNSPRMEASGTKNDKHCDFKAKLRHIPIPSKLKRELHRSSTLRKNLSSSDDDSSPSSRQFFDRLSEENVNSSLTLKVKHLCYRAKEIGQCFAILDQFLRLLNIDKASADQVRWCRQFFLHALANYNDFLEASHPLLIEARSRTSHPGTESEISALDSFFRRKKQDPSSDWVLTPVDAYRVLGLRRSSIHYESKKDLLAYVDRLNRLHRLQAMLVAINGVSQELPNLRSIVKHAKNPATAYRQLSMLIQKFPVMIFDDT